MYKVYWTDPKGNPCAEDHEDLAIALKAVEVRRFVGHRFVTMVSENPDSIGKPGVDEIRDGRLPDGNLYDWTKRR